MNALIEATIILIIATLMFIFKFETIVKIVATNEIKNKTQNSKRCIITPLKLIILILNI